MLRHTMIRRVTKADASEICRIYNHHVLNTIVTFEEEVVTQAAMEQRIEEIFTLSLPWFVFEQDKTVVGYAYASRWKSRCAYRYAVESTVYVASDATRRRIGSQLYQALISELKQVGMHSVIGGIALPNPASVALHEKLGFRKVAHFEQVGWKLNQWIDVGYWELIL